VSFPRYAEYKDSGLDWIGRIPEGWRLKPLKYVVSCNDEALPDNTPQDFAIMYVEISDVDEVQGITNLTQVPFGRAPSRARRIARDGDVLVSTVRTYLRAIAPVEQAPDNLVASTGFAVIRPRSLDYRFAGYLLRAEWLISRIIARSVGVNYPAIRADEIMALSVPVPSIREQRQIADFLDHETTKIDALIEEQRRLIELLEEKRQAVISHAVTKGLDPDAPMKHSGVEWLGEVPAHWQVAPTKRLLQFVTSGSRGWAQYYSERGELFFRITNLSSRSIHPVLDDQQFVSAPKSSEADRSRIEVGDLLISITADLGSVCLAGEEIKGAYVSQHVALARPNISVSSSKWLAYFVSSSCARAQFLGAGYGGTKIQLSLDDVKELKIAVPPPAEQVSIAANLDEELAEFEELRKYTEDMAKILKERRSALISAAVTGKVDVRNWQPRADSAEVLPMAAEEPATYETSEP